jgi:MFS family permease
VHGGAEGGSTFASLAYPAYRRLWISGLIVFLAVNAQGIARGWLAKEITGTNAGLGGVLLGFGVAMAVATPVGGVLADRLPKRTLVFWAHVLLTASSLWIGLAEVLDVTAYWMLIAAGAIQAVAFALYGPARMAFIAELVEGETMNNAIVLGQMSSEAMRIVGPTTAGMAIGAAAWGLEGVFLVCAALCGVATVLGLFLPKGEPNGDRPDRSPLGEMRDGVAYVRQRADLSLLMVTSLGVIMLAYPYLAFLPTLADDVFHQGSSGYGILSASSAVGAVGAGLFTAGRGGRLEPWRLATIAGTGFGIGLLLLSIAPLFGVALVVLAAVGGSSLTFETTTQSLLLSLSDFEYHGRIQSIVMLGYSGFGIVALPLGVCADAFGLRPTLAAMGAGVLAIVAVFVTRRQRIVEHELVLDLG